MKTPQVNSLAGMTPLGLPETTDKEKIAKVLVDMILACNTLYCDSPKGNDWVVELMNEASKLVTLPGRG